jgi:methyl-accepting chemotaxis protein
MADKGEIDKAIGAHGLWKSRLKQAIETGKTDSAVETIRMDNQCAFGKWLYGSGLSSTDKDSSHYKAVKDLHAQFHKTAAEVAGLAASGKKAEAERMMSLEGQFSAISSKLTAAMMDWKKTLA